MSARASVVIPLYNQAELTRACLAALERAGVEDVEIVLVDNGSTDDTVALLADADDSLTIIRNPENLGFATACNQGAAAAAAPVIVLLNNDTEVHEGWLEPLLEAVEDPAVGVAGSKLLYPDGRIQHAGMALMPGCVPIHLHRGAPGGLDVASRTRDLTLITAACMAVRRDLFIEVGGFDTGYRNGYEDADLCLRLADRSLVARYCDDSVVTHLESMSEGRSEAEDHNARLFRSRWLLFEADFGRLLAEDGLPDIGQGDCWWTGPLFGGSRRNSAGVEAVRELVAAGWCPLIREDVDGPCDPGADCPPEVLAGLNRHFVPLSDAPAFDPSSQGARRATARRAGVTWWGPLRGRSGYAAAGRGLLRAADGEGVPISARTLDEPLTGVPDPTAVLHAGPFVSEWWVLHHVPVSSTGATFWREMAVAIGRPTIGATCFESDGLPASWVEASRDVHEVWVPTAFNLRTFAAAGVDPDRLHAVPYPVDTDVFAPDGRSRADGPVTFASVFEWTWRKGWDVLLRAWVQEFAKGENVRLRILTYRGTGALGDGDIVEQATQCIREAGGDLDGIADIELILAPLSERDLIELYRSADAFVLPTRGEGAGMPIIEAMACGTPTIATAFGGHEELMDPELAFPVAVAGMVEAPAAQVRDNSLYRGQRLAEPDLASLRIAMRAVAEDPAGARERARAGRRVVEERFSIPVAGRALAERVDALTGRRAVSIAR